MTPGEWERCADPEAMVEFLRAERQAARSRAGRRRLRLFAAACCRRAAPLLTDPRSLRALEVVERLAEGRATPAQAARARRDADDARFTFTAAGQRAAGPAGIILAARREEAALAVVAALNSSVRDAAVQASARVANTAAYTMAESTRRAIDKAHRAELAAQTPLLRCLFGNPFRPPPAIGRAVLAGHGGAARRLAESIHAARRFEDLPVLADLLEEAGFTDAALLGHLRGPGPHCLGCHALDAVLGKW
jgi:hypothetical protein